MTAKLACLGAGVLLVLVLLVGGAAGMGAVLAGTGGGPATAPSDAALTDIPPSYLVLYQQGATECPGLSWTVLAAIGKVESDHGRSPLPGVRSGSNSAGAQGPMQFLPGSFNAYKLPVPPGGVDPPSPYDPVDAIHAAARYLCASGARDGRDLRAAVFAYNYSDAYVNQVLDQAARYTAPAPPGGPAGPPGAPQAATVADPSGTGGRVTPRTAETYQAVEAAGLIGAASCFGQRPELPTSDHPTGRACDFFFNPHDPAQVAAGWRLANWLTANAAAYGVKYLIWQGQIWQSNRQGWTTYTSTVYGCPNPANLTGCHYDHLHLSHW